MRASVRARYLRVIRVEDVTVEQLVPTRAVLAVCLGVVRRLGIIGEAEILQRPHGATSVRGWMPQASVCRMPYLQQHDQLLAKDHTDESVTPNPKKGATTVKSARNWHRSQHTEPARLMTPVPCHALTSE